MSSDTYQSPVRSVDSQSRGNSLLLWMLLASAVAGLLCMDPVVAFGGLVATALVAMLRREDESLVLLVCLGYQWLFVIAGITYRSIFGRYPSDYHSDYVDTAALLLLGALAVMGAGVWLALRLWSLSPLCRSRRPLLPEKSRYAVDKLFLCVVVLYLGSWLSTTSPKHVLYSVSQVFYRLLEFRTVFLFLLFLAVLRTRRGRLLALGAAAFVMLPLVTGGGSGFASVLIVLLAAALSEGRHLFTEGLSTARNRRIFALVCLVALTLVNLAIMWQGAVKSHWRPIARSEDLQASRIDRIAMFFEVAGASVSELDWNKGLESLAKRTSDVPMLMALVLERVPNEVPHQSGEQTLRAIRHIAMPRFLFPEKENLGSDSWLVRRFAGLNVAGEAQGTSIGLGYLVEFYVDYGAVGMLAAAFVFGAFVGSLHRLLVLAAPSMDLYRAAAAAILLQHFFALDASLAKIVGGLLMAYIVFGALLLLFGGVIHRALLAPATTSGRPAMMSSRQPPRVSEEAA